MAEVYLVDGSSLIYRSFHAIPRLTTSTGQPVNAVYGFTNSLFKLLKDRKPQYLLIAFDLKAPTFRHQLFQDYKVQRKPMPEELVEQVPTIKEIVACLGLRTVEQEGYEADDIIATLAGKFSRAGHQVRILTGDKDSLQLLSDRITVVNPADNELRDVGWFRNRFQLEPDSMVDLIALAGDQSDNIPGVHGIGEKTAVKLLREFGSMEGVYENLDRIPSASLREKLRAGKEQAVLSKKLAALESNLAVEFSLERVGTGTPKLRELLQLLERLEFKKLVNQLPGLFPDSSQVLSRKDWLGFSDRQVLDFAEIIQQPEKHRPRLEDQKMGKYGYNLKEKKVQLYWQGISLENCAFDLAVARYLTGFVSLEEDLFRTMAEYQDRLKKYGMENLFYKVEMPLIDVLAKMETEGIRVDTDYLNQLSEDFSGQLKVLEDQIYQNAGEVFNINSTQQLAEILFQKLGLPAGRKTKTGYSTDISVLRELAPVHPLPKLILEYRELFKLKSTYVEGLLPYVKKETGRIHPSFNQLITATGRLSCSNPNLQNIPIRTDKGSLIRKAFCAGEGRIFYSFDYNQIELRILAHFSEDANLTRAFREGKDIHQETAEILFSQASLFSRPAALPQSLDARRLAKTINFGVIYGMSPFGLAQELSIPAEEARVFIDSYFEKFPSVREYIGRTVAQAEKQGYVTTLLDRRRYIPELTSRQKNQAEFGKRVAINMPIQGSAADLIKLAMNRIYRFLKEEELKSSLVLQIHDELLFDVVPAEADRICGRIKEIMEQALPLKVPVKVDVKRGPNYLDLEKL